MAATRKVAPTTEQTSTPPMQDLAKELCDELRTLYGMDARGLRKEKARKLDALEDALRSVLGQKV